jgi:multidrug efflux system outer membrane protein
MHRTLLFLVSLWLTACSQMSEFQRPVPPVPAAWPGDVATSTPARTGATPRDASKIHWRSYFIDPQLQILIAAALENNRDLRIAAARVQEARAQYGIAKADLGPTINLLGQGDVSRSPADVSGTGAPVSSQRYDLSLAAVSFELDFWGRVAGLTEAARVSFLATEESRRSVYLSLVADVASSYFALLQMNELIVMSQSTVDLHAQSLALITKGRDLGGTNDFEFQQAVGQLESARASQDNLVHQRNVAANRLNFLMGNAAVALPQGGSLDAQGLDSDLAPGLPAEVLLTRPDVMASEQRLLAAHANIGAARAAFLPKILLTASLGAASQGLLGLFTGGAWSFQPIISLPIFDGGRIAAGVDVAEARKVIAVAEYEKTIQLAFREVADLLSSRYSLARQLHAANENTKVQARRLQISQGRYDAGMVSYLEVLAGERELLAAQQMGAQVRRAQLDATAQLYKALGGGEPAL